MGSLTQYGFYDSDTVLGWMCSNPDKLRTFIKAVYVERRYTGEQPQYSKGRQVRILF